MYKEAFEKLELADVATILDQVAPLLSGVQFDPIETTIMGVNVPFYKNFRFLDIADHTHMPSSHRYVLHSPQKSVVLDFTNGPIYALNESIPIELNYDSVRDYVRFFFTYVRGRHGRFLIVENIDDINWKEDPPPASRRTISKMIIPVTLKTVDPDGTFQLEATMLFKDCLFRGDITVTPAGLVTLENEQLLVEDLPVVDDILGQ
ncbi:MAG: hypothetical protein ACT4OY_01410 [Alphaproteobacteria bacterium]